MSGSENKANKDTNNNNFSEHIRDFLYKMCNWEVSRCRRAKCTKKRAALAKLFFANKNNCYFLPFSLPSPFSIT